MIIFLLFFINYFSVQIQYLDLFFLKFWLKNKILSNIFVLICFLFVVNGANLIDGFNGLLCINLIIVNSVLLFLNLNANHLEFAFFLTGQIIILVAFLLFNFPKAKIFLGDSGAYIIGFMISYFVIETSIQNNNVSPIFFCILLFYLFFEVLFSFCRKKLSNISPFLPDKNHLHMVLFRILNTKIFNNKLKSNYFTSVSINVTYMVMIFPTFFIYDNGFLCKLYFITLICIYLLIYFNLRKYEKKQN